MVPKLIAEKAAGLDIEEVIWDRGYSQLRPEMTSHPLNQAGIHQTFRPKERQRALKPFNEHAADRRPPRERIRAEASPGSSPDATYTYEQAFT